RNAKLACLTVVGSLALPVVAAMMGASSPAAPQVSQVVTAAAATPDQTIEIADAVLDEPEPELTTEEIAAQEAASREAAIRAASLWRVARGQSSIDDSRIVQINLDSNNSLPARFSGRGPATLSLRCQENTTSVTLRL